MHQSGTVAGLAVGGAVVFAATAVGVYRSTDGGQTWTLPGVGPSVPFANVVAISPRFAHDQTVFACGADGLYRSSDGGDTWHKVLVGSRTLSVVVAQDAGRDTLTVLAGTETDGILRSEDSGRTWAGANAGLLDLTAISLALSPRFESDHTGFAGTASGLYRTRNSGRSWRFVDTGTEEPAVQYLAVSPNFSDDRLVLAGSEADGLLRSVDGGASWSRPPSLASGGVAAVAFAARYPGVPTIAAATESGIALSRDGGETWVPAGEGRELVMSLIYTEHELLAGLHQRGIIRSTDGGSTWQQSIDGLSARLDTELVISPGFARDRTLFVAGLEDGVRASTDCGVTWADHGDGLDGVAVYGLAASADERLYAATSDGIRVGGSHDEGALMAGKPAGGGGKKGPQKGTGGHGRRKLSGKGPTPKAEGRSAMRPSTRGLGPWREMPSDRAPHASLRSTMKQSCSSSRSWPSRASSSSGAVTSAWRSRSSECSSSTRWRFSTTVPNSRPANVSRARARS